MKVSKYIKLAAGSKILLSWLLVFSLISAYMSFSEFLPVEIGGFFVVYILLCFGYLWLVRKKLDTPRMSYVIHPLFFAAEVIAFFITLVEDDGRMFSFQSVYLLFIISFYMLNCYLSSLALSLTNGSGSRATVIMKYSGYRTRLFWGWLTAFVLAALICLFIPIKGKNIFTPIEINRNTSSEEEKVTPEEEEFIDGTEEKAESYEDNKALSFVLTALVIIIFAAILFLSRKIIFKDKKAKGFEYELPDEIEEEITEVKKKRNEKNTETVSGSAAARVRKYFLKTVKSYYPERVNEAKTPEQLLIYGEEEEKEMRSLYEKARYSDRESDKSEAARAKEVSSILIKKHKKAKQY